jgi:hypothetical protein
MFPFHFCMGAVISEGMVLAMMATDVTLLAAALIVVSLVELGASGERFSIDSALRRERGVRLARTLRILVGTSVLGFIIGIGTIWIRGELIKIITIVLGSAATIEFGVITLATLALLLSPKPDEE